MARWIIIALLLFPNIALGGVYVSGGVDPVEIGRRIAVSSPGVITLASGSVTLANMKLSAVNGTAFVDFSTANVLTDYVPYKGKLTITDSAGKKLTGYIKAQGTGETYGSELITNGDMETGDPPTGYTVNTAGGAVISSAGDERPGGAGAQSMHSLRPAGGWIWTKSISLSSGGLYLFSVWQKCVSGSFSRTVFQSGKELLVRSSSWTYGSNYNTAIVSSETISHHNVAGGENRVDDLSLKQVLTPAVTGVTITSTADGTTYNWESKESGFNYNNSSGYTYTITTR